MSSDTPDLWTPIALPPGSAALWRLGPLTLQATARAGALLVEWSRDSDPTAGAASLHIRPPEPLRDAERRQVATRDATVVLRPLLADRSVVVFPADPLLVPGGASLELAVTTPLWVRLTGGDGAIYAELPAWRPSDTWFGPRPTEGALAYASRTRARIGDPDLICPPSRAATAVRVTNRGAAALSVERLNLPMPELSLYRTADGVHHTQPVQIAADAGDVVGEVRLGRPDPQWTAVAGPRSAARPDLLRRALASLLG